MAYPSTSLTTQSNASVLIRCSYPQATFLFVFSLSSLQTAWTHLVSVLFPSAIYTLQCLVSFLRLFSSLRSRKIYTLGDPRHLKIRGFVFSLIHIIHTSSLVPTLVLSARIGERGPDTGLDHGVFAVAGRFLLYLLGAGLVWSLLFQFFGGKEKTQGLDWNSEGFGGRVNVLSWLCCLSKGDRG